MLNVPRQGLKAGLPVWKAVARNPIKVSHYLYFLGSQQVTTDGGAVSSWGDAGLSTLTRTLAQSTANLQPAHDTSDNHLTFDTTTGEKDKLAFNSAVTQAGVLVVATSNGIFAYEVDADSVDEITALGFETGYYQALDLYAYILFPTSITAVELAGVIRYLDENTNATKNPVGSLASYWKYRMDVVTPKFDNLDFSGVTSVQNAWQIAWGSSGGITSFPSNIDLSNCTNFGGAWYNTSLTTFPVLDVSSGTTFNDAWVNTTIVDFPALAFPEGTSFQRAWSYAYSTHSFGACTFSLDPDDDINFSEAWRSHSNAAFTSFPALNLSRGTNFNYAWHGCNKLTSFPAITFSTHADDDINFTAAWQSCTQLESFPALNLSRGTNFTSAWEGCTDTSFTSFPAVTFSTTASDVINFTRAWKSCEQLTSFPALNLSRGTQFGETWNGCTRMVTWNKCTFGASANFQQAWRNTGAMTSFPSDVDLSMGTDFWACWYDGAIVSFPALDLSAGGDFNYAFGNNPDMVSFGACNMNAGRGFGTAWYSNTAMTTFPAGVFDDWAPTSVSANCFLNAWYNCNALTEQSIENILLSISASGVWATSTGTSSGTVLAGKEISIGLSNANVNVDNLSASNRAACTALQSRGWEVVINGSLVSEYALSLNGTDEYVDTGYIIPAIATQTNACWAKGTDTGYQILMSDFESSGSNTTSRVNLGFYNQDIYISIGDGSAFYYATGANTYDATSTFFDGNWHHIALTINAETQKFYIDGVLRHTHDTTDAGTRSGGTSAVLGTAGTGSTAIGRFGAYDGGYWDGEIDEVAVWDVALDAAAVLAVYNAGSPINLNRDKGNYDNASDIVSWWRMGDSDSGAGNFVTDVIATDGEALHLPGIAANYASVPDAADLDGFVNFTLEAKGVTLPDWTPSTYQGLMSKYRTSGDERSWRLEVQGDGTLSCIVAYDGATAVTLTSTAATGLAAGATANIMALRNGADVRFYVNGVKLGDDVTVATTALHNSTDVVAIGAGYDTTGTPMTGSIQRARVWNSAVANQATPTETPVLDVNFALANKGATSFTATSGQVVTVHSTAIANPAAIRSATDGVLANSPTFVVDNPPNYSDYSLSFNGSDEYATSSADGTLADKTYSFWAKSSVTSAGDRNCVFAHGANNKGGFFFNWSSSRPLLYLGTSYYKFWDDSPAQDDGKWHHWAVVVDVSDVTACQLYVDGILQSRNADATTSANVEAYAALAIGRSGDAGEPHFFNGSLDEFAVFDGLLTSAQINDLSNAGRPATVTGAEHWYRMGEDNAGTGTAINDMGSGSDHLTLVNAPTFSRSVPAEDATWNNRSLDFNGSNEYMTSTADDTLATKSYSFWAKSSDTGTNHVFDHGGASIGAFHFNYSSGRPLLYMASGYYRYWVDSASQDDGNWHHHVVYIEHDDITNCKWYVDGAVQTASSSNDSPPASAYTTGIRVGHAYFDGNLDEFAIFDGELTPSQVLQIYNGGKPASLKEHSPESWWRMGDDDDTGGTTIRDLGVVSTTELVTNGEFGNNTTGWTLAESATLSVVEYAGESRLRIANAADANYGGAWQEVTVVVGARYKVSVTAAHSLGNAPTLELKVGTSQGGSQLYWDQGITGDETITQYITATTTSMYILLQNSGGFSTLAYFDNISVKQDDLVLNGTMEVDSNWYNFTSPTTNERSTTRVKSGTYSRKCITDSGGDGLKSGTFTVTAGQMYEVTCSFYMDAGGASGGILLRLQNGDGADVGASYHQASGLAGSWQTKTFYTTVTTTGSSSYFKIYQNGTGVTTFYLDDVSVRQVNGNPATLVNTPTFSIDIP